MPLILGVDIGAAGGLALHDAEGDLLDIEPMLVLSDAERPGVTTFRLCGVLGGLAGVVLGQAVPTASAEVDDVHRDAVAGSFRMALLEARERGQGVN